MNAAVFGLREPVYVPDAVMLSDGALLLISQRVKSQMRTEAIVAETYPGPRPERRWRGFDWTLGGDA